MKRILFLVAVVAIFTQCDGIEEQTKNKVAIEQLLTDFEACKEASTERKACKHFTAEAICKYNGIDDFENDEGGYLDYDDLFVAIVDSPYWEFLGDANDQKTLDDAQSLADRGFPVVCVDAKGDNHFIVLIITGEMTKSGKWGLNCPNSAAFFPKKRPESYINKTLNYSWKKPKGLEIYVKR
ncbi:MAG: hypothetical protein JKY54_02765 [Flavobacteriales bacterium]|nr:hypothetical protein [Flavobacteriales bacterium]